MTMRQPKNDAKFAYPCPFRIEILQQAKSSGMIIKNQDAASHFPVIIDYAVIKDRDGLFLFGFWGK
jgi:hypothetical protein